MTKIVGGERESPQELTRCDYNEHLCTDEPELAKVKVKHKESAAKNRKDQSEYFKENYQNCCKKIARQRAQKKSANFFHSKKCNKNHKICKGKSDRHVV